MKTKIYIDGQEGTTGLKIMERFENRNDITSIMIPANIIEINLEIFYGCSNLTSVEIMGPATIWDGAFDGILEPGVKLDLRFACKQYSAETFKGDMMGFKRSVESELVYDV